MSGSIALAERFAAEASRNECNRRILERLPSLNLPQCWLVAGCLFQTVWNLRCSQAPQHGIQDYDVFYFDASDLSAEAELQSQARAEALFADLGVTVEVKNQARVHLWYPEYFGQPYSALQSAEEGIGRFLVLGTCVGLRREHPGDALQLCAPYGLDDLFAGRLAPNPACDHRDLFLAKSRSYQARWPWLQIAAHPEA